MNEDFMLEHAEFPRRFNPTFEPTAKGRHVHAACNDEIEISIFIDEDGVIEDIGFTGHGCVICIACASILCEGMHRLSPDEAKSLAPRYMAPFQTEVEQGRERCVTVSLRALQKALEATHD
jgi:nitrogen fixation protein NifU and related proteins